MFDASDGGHLSVSCGCFAARRRRTAPIGVATALSRESANCESHSPRTHGVPVGHVGIAIPLDPLRESFGEARCTPRGRRSGGRRPSRGFRAFVMRRKTVDIGADRGMRAYVTGGARQLRRAAREGPACALWPAACGARRARWLASRARLQTLHTTHRPVIGDLGTARMKDATPAEARAIPVHGRAATWGRDVGDASRRRLGPRYRGDAPRSAISDRARSRCVLRTPKRPWPGRSTASPGASEGTRCSRRP